MQWALDAQGRVIHRSQEWLDFTGLPADDPRGTMRSRAVHPDDSQVVEGVFKEALAARSPFLMTFRLRCGDNRFAWVTSGATPSLSPVDGSFLGYIGTTEPMSLPPDTPRALSILYARDQLSSKSRSLLDLDAIAEHITAARSLAERTGDFSVVATLDSVLILIGDLIYRALQLPNAH